MSPFSRAAVRAAFAAALLAGGSAAAQDKDADAERLFREGQKLMEERRLGEACPKFEAAYAKDRQLGTLLNLAFCHKEQGAVWYAWLEFREAEVKAAELNRSDRREFAHERLVELEKSLPKVVVDNPQKVLLTEVLVEERRVPEAERGAVFAAEEGKRKFTFRATGKKAATVLVSVASKADRPQHVAVPEMAEGPDESLQRAQPAASAAPTLPSPQRAAPPPQAPPPEEGGGRQRTFAFVAFGVAGAAFVAGSVTGVMTMSNACADNFLHAKSATCTASDKDSAGSLSTVATISFVAAGALGVGGLALLVTAPSRRVGTERAGVALRPEIGVGWAGVRGVF